MSSARACAESADKEIDRTKTAPIPAMHPLISGLFTVQRLKSSRASTAAAPVDAEAKAKRKSNEIYARKIRSYFK